MSPIVQKDEIDDHFNRVANDYERVSRGIPRQIVQHLLPLLPPITNQSLIHDNACGPGIATTEILNSFSKHPQDCPKIYATDNNVSMVKALQAILNTQYSSGLAGQVTAAIADSEALEGFASNHITHSITNIGIHVFPHPEVAAKRIYQTLTPGGTAAITIWKDNNTLDMVGLVQKSIRPDLPKLELVDPNWQKEQYLIDVLIAGGFARDAIELHIVTVSAKAESDIDLVSMFDGIKVMAVKDWTADEKGRWNDAVMAILTHDQKDTLVISNTAWVAVCRKGQDTGGSRFP